MFYDLFPLLQSMEYYSKGIGPGGSGQFPQQNFVPGPVGDGMPNNMWNPQMKGQVSETSDKAVSRWHQICLRKFLGDHCFHLLIGL
jgi:hypothetical protein